MATVVIPNLAPGRTAILQLYSRCANESSSLERSGTVYPHTPERNSEIASCNGKPVNRKW